MSDEADVPGGPRPIGRDEADQTSKADASRDQVVQTRAIVPPGPAGRMALAAMPVERSENFGATTRRLVGRLRPERTGAIAVISFALVGVTMSVVGPKILGRATNIVFDGLRGTNGQQGIDFHRLHNVLLLAAGLYVTSSALQWLQSFVLAGVVQRTMLRLRAEVEDKLNRLPLHYVDRQARGDLLSRVTNDIDNVAQSLQQTLSMLLTSTLTLVGVLVMMFVISWQLALVALVTIPLSLLAVRFITARSRPRFMAQWRHTGVLNAHVEEVFTGHALVKAFGRQADVERRFDEENDHLYEASFGAQFISGTMQPAMMFLGNLNYVAIAVIGGLRVSSGALTLGDVQAFIQYSRQFSMPLTQLASMANVLQSGIASAERVFELLDAPEEVAEVDEPHAAQQARGRVEFDHVSFAYQPDKPLIEDLSLVAEPGRTVAIVGPTGAGKTTLVNLLMRFYELDAGSIRLDGRDIASMPRHELRSHMGMVLQDAWLFGGTIRENIAYGNLKATEDELLAAAKATYVDRFVRALPDGYDTIIDDEGSNVSAGERQLITIARAFLADPTILILDEATSSVDTRTEVLIQRAMAALRSQRTSFVIAHRLSTIRDADTILVMDAGRIVEQGNHTMLLAKGGAYFTLYNSQFAAPATDVA
ncbi:MAG TPA: ABC transporter ATP-binding protein [Acidimicrobiales bacterium]|jgi:ATP-binding cassette subfamily B protein|nr:ABC transporter ATP-binding protein [Acidimicrobiales bacterium]